MHHLLGFKVGEDVWRRRFQVYLRSFGKEREADLIASMAPQAIPSKP